MQGAAAHGFTGELWTVAQIGKFIDREFGIAYHLRMCGGCCGTGWAGARRGPSARPRNATRPPSSAGSTRTGRGSANARRRRACLVFLDESGVSLLPNVRRTWAPRGRPPLLRHHFNWKRASMAAALCYGIGGSGAQLAFHVQAGSYDTASLIGVLKQLRRFLGGQQATLVWDGLGAHRSRAMRAFWPPSGTGWWWSGCRPVPRPQPG